MIDYAIVKLCVCMEVCVWMISVCVGAWMQNWVWLVCVCMISVCVYAIMQCMYAIMQKRELIKQKLNNSTCN